MSQARDTFYELLSPKLESLGYVFNKSKFNFSKSLNNLNCSIEFSWDGRGGTTYLNHVGIKISCLYVAKSLKVLVNTKDYPFYWRLTSGGHFDDRIPQMYSQELMKLGNDMAFKKMAAMSFEEKYPLEKIKKTVTVVQEIITSEIVPCHNEMADEHKILQFKIDNLLTKLNDLDTHNIMWEILIIKIMSKKLNIAYPKFVSDITIFSNSTIDDLWNMQDYDFENMEAKFNNLKF